VENELEDEQTDARLVERAQRGDRAAFAALVERYQQPVGSYLWRLTRDRELALDLTQDTFLRAYRSIGTTPRSLLVRPWLFRIATNLAYDYFRRNVASAACRLAGSIAQPLRTRRPRSKSASWSSVRSHV